MQPSARDDASFERFEDLYRNHYGELLRFVARRVDDEAARDVVAEVFLTAWRRRADAPARNARAWLFGVARLTVANEERGQRRRRHLLEAVNDGQLASAAFAADIAERIADSAAVDALLAELPYSDRQLLLLTEWDGLSVKEAAIVLGCLPATARVRLHRARRRLGELFERHRSPAESIPITSGELGAAHEQ